MPRDARFHRCMGTSDVPDEAGYPGFQEARNVEDDEVLFPVGWSRKWLAVLRLLQRAERVPVGMAAGHLAVAQ